jgi:8-oxo-dGTP diphosphatase
MKTIEVVAAIIVCDGRLLATQRGYGEFAGGWEFPGGKIEPGETPEAALVREIHEELAAEINVEYFLTRINYAYETFELDMRCYVCTLKSAVTLLEHSAAKWLAADELDQLDWLPADIQVVQDIKRNKVI